MARPVSALRVALSAELVDGPGTSRELWRRIGCEWSMLEVRIALRNMVTAEEAELIEPVRVEGVRRPVPVYRRRMPAAHAACTQGMADLIAVWAGLAPVDPMGAAM